MEFLTLRDLKKKLSTDKVTSRDGFNKLVNTNLFPIKNIDITFCLQQKEKVFRNGDRYSYYTLQKTGKNPFAGVLNDIKFNTGFKTKTNVSDSGASITIKTPALLNASKLFKDLCALNKIHYFDDVGFYPYLHSKDNRTPRFILNLFDGFFFNLHYKQKFKFDATGSFYLKHIKQCICDNNEELYKYIIQFIAQLIQQPFIKPDISLCIAGQEGSGKDCFTTGIMRIIGENFCIKTEGADILFDKFNDSQERTLLVICNELADGGSAVKQRDRLKGIITREDKWIEPKGQKKYCVKDYSRYIFQTNNEEYPISLGRASRRYLMMRTSNDYINNSEWFKKIWLELEDPDWLKTFFDYFATYDISDFCIRRCPKTAYEVKSKIAQSPASIQFIIHLLKFLDEPGSSNCFLKKYSDNKIFVITSKELYRIYGRYNESYNKSSKLLNLSKFKKLCIDFGIGFKRRFRKATDGCITHNWASVLVFEKGFFINLINKYYGNKYIYTFDDFDYSPTHLTDDINFDIINNSGSGINNDYQTENL